MKPSIKSSRLEDREHPPVKTEEKISKKDGKIYFERWPIPVLDPKTFEPLVEGYSRDANNLYYEDYRIYKADPNTFKPAKFAMTSLGPRWGHFGTVKGGIIYGEHFIPVADETKVVWGDPINDGTFGFKHSTDYGLEKIEGLDLATTKQVPISPYMQDKNSVYLRWERLPGCDPKKFEHPAGSISMCGDKYYYDTDLIVGDFPKKWLETYYHDDDHTGYHPEPGKVIFIKRSEVKEIKFGYDEVRGDIYFMEHKIQGLDKSSYEVINGYFLKDKNSVFYQGKKIEGADPKSFEVIEGESLAFDKNTAFYAGRKVINLDVKDKKTDPRFKDLRHMRLLNDREAIYMGALTDQSLFKDATPAKPK